MGNLRRGDKVLHLKSVILTEVLRRDVPSILSHLYKAQRIANGKIMIPWSENPPRAKMLVPEV